MATNINAAKRYKDIKIYHTNIDKLNTKTKFNFVRISHVVEHIDEPNIFFKRIYPLGPFFTSKPSFL